MEWACLDIGNILDLVGLNSPPTLDDSGHDAGIKCQGLGEAALIGRQVKDGPIASKTVARTKQAVAAPWRRYRRPGRQV
jgi:hypothetical protein